MIKKYTVELEGQKDFYGTYLPIIDSTMNLEDILVENTDGVINGNLLEFKLNICDLNTVLFQAIKYLSAFRIKGKPLPANIILVSLNDGKAYCYHSNDYLEYIETVYVGSASKDNSGFVGGHPLDELDYTENALDEQKLISYLRQNKFTKIHLDENCIVGWASLYYRLYPNARKSDFIGDLTGKVKIVGEIRKPNKFAEYIYPYQGSTNSRFQYLMDKLNDDIQKKNLGAFYTPTLYAQKSLELVRDAISRVPKGNDYIILDRCAGTGNLEQFLSDEEKSHAILSTIEYYEYKVLLELLGDKVRYIIPPVEREDTFNMGLVRGADALSEEYINNPVIKQYLDNPKCTIILFENPPYAESNGTTRINGEWKNSYIVTEMKKEVKGTVSNDLGNAFIWSAFKYYLRQPTDSYIVYSPVKYWKVHHLVNKRFVKGLAFNRRYFHTNIDACITCIHWLNIDDFDTDEIVIQGYDIISNKLSNSVYLPIKKIYYSLSDKYYERTKVADNLLDGICTELNGTEYTKNHERVKKYYSTDMIGYLCANSTGFDNPDLNSGLTVAGRYDGNGFFLHVGNYLDKLPMFAASRYITYNREWTERARIMKSGDGAEHYYADVAKGKLKQFLLQCLLFTCLEMQNHMQSFQGSDGRFYRNELCLDTTNGETIASKDIKSLKVSNKEKELLDLWCAILEAAKTTRNYNSALTYGVYQIATTLDTFEKDKDTGENVYHYPELHGHLRTLKTKIRAYYNEEIVPTLFEYEFLK